MKSRFAMALFVTLFSVLSLGCGPEGDNNVEDDTDDNEITLPLPAPTAVISLASACSGSYCGNNGNSHKGSGVGIWSAKNTEAPSASLDIELSNVANKEIMVVFTNEGHNVPYYFPNIYVDTSLKKNIYEESTEDFDETIHFNKKVDLQKLLEQDDVKKSKSISPKVWNTGDKESWIIEPYDKRESRTAILVAKGSSSGRNINFWVESSEYQSTKISQDTIRNIANKFVTLYSYAVSLAGEPWGTHGYGNLIAGSNQPLNIVFVNFDNNNKGGGVAGYFYGRNNFLNAEGSNEALALFIDTETIYAKGTLVALSTIMHEFTHAINFYQRDILIDDDFDTFLEEMSANMMEDVLSNMISTTYSDTIDRYSSWIKNATFYNVDFSNWKSESSYYDITASFGAFLLRQYGVEFYKNLFITHSDPSISKAKLKSLNILDKVIKPYNNSGGLGRALRHWGASIALLPYNASPSGFGYPRKISGGFTLKEIDGNSYINTRKLPTSSPSVLRPHANFPFLRRATNGIYKESFVVPQNVSVTIVVK
ncbi:MAG: hypothetical protein LBT96_00330 [Campylobacteraceae bacterium]|jgi:hypothetical protein|nr:hypothetical protein [Campylobacteraceae bacterium]